MKKKQRINKTHVSCADAMAQNAEIKLNALHKWIVKLESNFCEMNKLEREKSD